MTIKVWWAICVALFLCGPAHAGWTAASAVSTVYSHDDMYYIITSITNSPCGVAGRFWWPTSDADAKDMYAMALTAFVSGKPIAVYYNDSAPNCVANAALVTHMYITE